MKRTETDTPKRKITILMLPRLVDDLDQAALDARGVTGVHVDRSELVAAIVESVDIPEFALRIAGGAK